jgi:hypothetical protein
LVQGFQRRLGEVGFESGYLKLAHASFPIDSADRHSATCWADVFGDALNIAARVQSADPGTVAITDARRRKNQTDSSSLQLTSSPKVTVAHASTVGTAAAS